MWARASQCSHPTMAHLRFVLAIPGLFAWQLLTACTQQRGAFVTDKPRNYPTDSAATPPNRFGGAEGLYGPESGRYSPETNAFFVPVMNGPGPQTEKNG